MIDEVRVREDQTTAETLINCGAMLIYILIVIGLAAHKCHAALQHRRSVALKYTSSRHLKGRQTENISEKLNKCETE